MEWSLKDQWDVSLDHLYWIVWVINRFKFLEVQNKLFQGWIIWEIMLFCNFPIKSMDYLNWLGLHWLVNVFPMYFTDRLGIVRLKVWFFFRRLSKQLCFPIAWSIFYFFLIRYLQEYFLKADKKLHFFIWLQREGIAASYWDLSYRSDDKNLIHIG